MTERGDRELVTGTDRQTEKKKTESAEREIVRSKYTLRAFYFCLDLSIRNLTRTPRVSWMVNNQSSKWRFSSSPCVSYLVNN